ncbi:MAG: sulfotransferase domain-containing protein [Acidimicrobiia bacterium]
MPSFLIIGAMKTGTTSLYHYLRHHPEVFMPETKELDFFVERRNWKLGIGWYEAQFAEAGAATAVGEASPNYTKRHDDPDVAARIADTLPDVRLIYLVRHPLERMVSMYRQTVADGVEARPIEEAFAANRDYLLTSMYAWQLEPYLERFPQEHILVLTTESLRRQRAATVARVFEFLGVDPSWRPPSLDREVHRGNRLRVPRPGLRRFGELPGYRSLLNRSWRLRNLHQKITTRPAPRIDTTLTPKTEAALTRELAPDVAKLYDLVDGDFDGWGLA